METLNCSVEELRQIASKVLAAAVLELFPETLIVSSHLTSQGFCCDFVFPFQFTTELLSLVEDRMGQILRDKREARVFEMVPVSAAAFFEHHGQPLLAEKVRNQGEPLLTLCQIGEYVDFCPNELSFEHSNEIRALKLLTVSQKQRYMGYSVTQIGGTAFFEKDELKEFLKRREEFPQKDHLLLGAELELFSLIEERCVWHKRGEKLRQLLVERWKEELLQQNFESILTRELGTDLTANHSKYFLLRQKSHARFVEFSNEMPPRREEWQRGLLTPEHPTCDLAHVFCTSDDLFNICISSLQIIWKMLKILDFKFRVVICLSRGTHKRERDANRLLEEALRVQGMPYTVEERSRRYSGPTVEVRIQDGMGQEWAGPFVGVDCRQLVQEEIVVFSLFNSLERCIALLLEQGDGELPLWLAPEQVRVVGVKENEYATEISQLLHEAGIRSTLDIRGDKLAKRLHEALSRKIPWLVVVGERERKDQLITVRSFSSSEPEEMNVESFIQRILTTEVSSVENQ